LPVIAALEHLLREVMLVDEHLLDAVRQKEVKPAR
jgi:hypothetical protein